MKKAMATLSIVAVLGWAATLCSKKEEKASETTTIPAITAVQYTCPMHPEVVTDAPGTCQKCGMDLVKKEAAATPADSTMKMEGDSAMKM